jgi:hypothetical protein
MWLPAAAAATAVAVAIFTRRLSHPVWGDIRDDNLALAGGRGLLRKVFAGRPRKPYPTTDSTSPNCTGVALPR